MGKIDLQTKQLSDAALANKEFGGDRLSSRPESPREQSFELPTELPN